MSRYELLYIIPSTLTDEEVSGVEGKVAALLAKFNATVEATRRLGKFRLAYSIKGQRHGHYVLVMFNAEHAVIAKLDENIKIMPEVVRHLILRAEEGVAEQKFDLVQWTEVNVEKKEDRPRRRDKEAKEDASTEVIKAEVEEEKPETPVAVEEAKSELSAAELEAKIESALSADLKQV